MSKLLSRRTMGPPTLTKTWHKDTYAAIDPRRRPDISLKGKTVVISGGGSGIGKGLSAAFASAGASRIAILGRRESVLQQARQEIETQNRDVSISTHATDVTDLSAVEKAAQHIGPWDVLISNAGYLPDIKHLVDSDPEDWWKAFEVNVRGTYNLVRSFLPQRRPGAVLIGVSVGSIQIEAMSANFSAYNASKLAAVKMLENVAAETPDLHVVSMHPGVVESEMSAKSSMGKTGAVSKDAVELPGHFAVWLCSNEAKFLRGKFVWSNWDVEELQEKRAWIEGSLMLTANCIGWPYSP